MSLDSAQNVVSLHDIFPDKISSTDGKKVENGGILAPCLQKIVDTGGKEVFPSMRGPLLKAAGIEECIRMNGKNQKGTTFFSQIATDAGVENCTRKGDLVRRIKDHLDPDDSNIKEPEDYCRFCRMSIEAVLATGQINRTLRLTTPIDPYKSNMSQNSDPDRL